MRPSAERETRGGARSPFSCNDYPSDPYPGRRPGVSFVEVGGTGWAVRGDPAGGWTVGARDLDAWLARHGAAPLAGRLPLLAYGSNACPGKLEWLREQGLRGPAVVVEADVVGAAAVWTAGFRMRDDQRPAVLAAVPGTVERHAVWFVTSDQRAVLDRVEGRGSRYRLGWVRTPVLLGNGERLDRVLAYVAPRRPATTDPRRNRAPLLVDGQPVRVADVSQVAARALVGTTAAADGLDVVEVAGEPA